MPTDQELIHIPIGNGEMERKIRKFLILQSLTQTSG